MTTPDTRVLSNQRVTVWIGPDTGITNWSAPTLAQVVAMKNVSEAIRWNGFNFNIKASTQTTDTSLTDAAGAQTRTYNQFGGAIEFFTPQPGDTSSILYQVRQLVKTPRTMLAIVIRTITLNSVGVAISDELNTYHVQTDQNTVARSDASYSYSINMVPQNDMGLQCIIPAVVPLPVVLTPSGPLTGVHGGIGYVTAAYQGLNITVGAIYASTNPAVATVSPHGIIQYLTAGTTSISATYPGSAAGVAQVLTVT